jgi:hypothetical protein
MTFEDNNQKESEISLIDFILKIKSIYKFLKKKFKYFFLSGVIGGAIGILFAIYTPIRYISKVTFVIEESKSGGGGLSAIAGQFGFDLGGGSGGSLFSGDNILLFLKSENLCREILFTSYDSLGLLTLADKYAEVKGFKKTWKENSKIGEISFAKYRSDSLPRKEDSLLQILIKKHILAKDLFINKPDKKASFVQVIVSSVDEKFSALFSQRLVKIASDKYVQSKIKLKARNVAILQSRADSLSELLNIKTYKAASSQQKLIDYNPALKTSPIVAEISTREKSMIGTIFAEVVKNLEIAKSILSQETPAIELVDQSTFPLEKVKPSKIKSFITWALFFSLCNIFYLLLSNWVRKAI